MAVSDMAGTGCCGRGAAGGCPLPGTTVVARLAAGSGDHAQGPPPAPPRPRLALVPSVVPVSAQCVPCRGPQQPGSCAAPWRAGPDLPRTRGAGRAEPGSPPSQNKAPLRQLRAAVSPAVPPGAPPPRGQCGHRGWCPGPASRSLVSTSSGRLRICVPSQDRAGPGRGGRSSGASPSPSPRTPGPAVTRSLHRRP